MFAFHVFHKNSVNTVHWIRNKLLPTRCKLAMMVILTSLQSRVKLAQLLLIKGESNRQVWPVSDGGKRKKLCTVENNLSNKESRRFHARLTQYNTRTKNNVFLFHTIQKNYLILASREECVSSFTYIERRLFDQVLRIGHLSKVWEIYYRIIEIRGVNWMV